MGDALAGGAVGVELGPHGNGVNDDFGGGMAGGGGGEDEEAHHVATTPTTHESWETAAGTCFVLQIEPVAA